MEALFKLRHELSRVVSVREEVCHELIPQVGDTPHLPPAAVAEVPHRMTVAIRVCNAYLEKCLQTVAKLEGLQASGIATIRVGGAVAQMRYDPADLLDGA